MKLILPFLSCILVGVTAFAEIPVGSGPFRNLELEKKEGDEIAITVTDPGSHFWSGPIGAEYDPQRDSIISFEYFAPKGVEALSVRFRQRDGSMMLAASTALPLAEAWQPFSIDLRQSELLPPAGDPKLRFHFALKSAIGNTLQIRDFVLRAPNEEENERADEREKILRARQSDATDYLNYLRDWYPNRIDEFVVDEKTISVKGFASEPLLLLDLAPEMPSHTRAREKILAADLIGDFAITFARYEVNTRRDRAFSRVRLSRPGGLPASHARWPDEIAEEIPRDLPKLDKKSQKGLGGMPFLTSADHEIFELGIDHATVNFLINALIFDHKRPGLVPFPFEGETYYLDPRYLARQKKTIELLCAEDIVVSCILLVGNVKDRTLTHPDAERRGVYSMPNLTSPAGEKLYRAAMSVICEACSTPDCRISNWIIHNEIDQAGVWTNMGDQPLARFLEIYMRSTRIVYQTARLHDPHARVFVSLTHHWTKPSLGIGAYTVRPLVELFAEMARAEGDFEWGLAYHPYPQNLRNPDTWLDDKVTMDWDTPYITPKNMEVLPSFLAQDRFLYQGQERPILFSEQGFNTPTLDEADQKRQVAGLVYTFRKLRDLPTVEAYHLHRYQDMPDKEGGLRLGIIDENGNRKLGWDAYAAIGTGDEAEFDAITDELIPEVEPVAIERVERPNIVLIVADDLGWSDTTPYLDAAEDFYETPAIASLAKRGMKFTHAYAASPLCSPTRASILTGQYPGRIRLTTPNCHTPVVNLNPTLGKKARATRPVIEPETRTRFPNFYETIPERLGLVGYDSAFVGKWHLGRTPYLPDQQGFSHVVGGREHPGPPGGFFAPWPIETIPDAPVGTHIDDQITDESIAWIKEKAAADEPFFLNLWYYSVHAPFEAKADLIAKYEKKAEGLPINAPRSNPVMAAMIETLDVNVGRIANTLEELGLSENTLIVFTSDNGGNQYNYTAGQFATNNAPLRNGKGNINEGGQRVPMIAVWPGRIDPDVTNDGLVSSIDLFPTLLEAASAPAAPSQVIDGTSLLSVFTGEEEIAVERTIFCHFPHAPSATGTVGGTSARRGPWKLTRFFGMGPNQSDRLRLVNLERDPGERNDVSATHPVITAELDDLISENLQETDSLISIPNPAYRPTSDGWKGGGDATLRKVDDFLVVASNGIDPQITTNDFAKASGKVSIQIVIAGEPKTPISMHWATNKAPGFVKERLETFTKVGPGTWRADLDLGEERLTNLRIDPAQGKGEVRIDSISLIDWKAGQDGEGRVVRAWDFL